MVKFPVRLLLDWFQMQLIQEATTKIHLTFKYGSKLYGVECRWTVTNRPVKPNKLLSLRFGTALPETVNITVYTKFPEMLKIDQARMVTIG